jgi:elongation factor G
MEREGHFTKILARVPQAEMFDYCSSLRSITQGRAKFRMSFADYQVVPFELQKKLQEEYHKTAKEEAL